MDPVGARHFRPLVLAFVVALSFGTTAPCLAADTRPDTIINLDRFGSFEDQRAELLELRREVCVRWLARQRGRVIIMRSGVDHSSRETLNFSPSSPNGMIVETTVVSSMIVPMQDLQDPAYAPPAEPEKGSSGPTFDTLELLRTDGEPIPLNDATDCAAVGRGGILVRLRNSKAGTSESW